MVSEDNVGLLTFSQTDKTFFIIPLLTSYNNKMFGLEGFTTKYKNWETTLRSKVLNL